MVRLEMSDNQALDAIRDLSRACVLLDQCAKRCDDPAVWRACIQTGNALHDLIEDVDHALRGLPGRVERAAR